MAEKRDIAAGEEEWIRNIFINKMKNYDIQRKLVTETLPPRENREFGGVINAWSELGHSENDDYSVLNITTIFDDDGKELKKLLNIGLGNENQVILNRQVGSAIPVSFLKKNVLHELKLRDPYFKIYPKEKATEDLYGGFTDNAISISGKVILPIFSKLLVRHDDCHFFVIEGHEVNILGNDNLPKVGIEVSQK